VYRANGLLGESLQVVVLGFNLIQKPVTHHSLSLSLATRGSRKCESVRTPQVHYGYVHDLLEMCAEVAANSKIAKERNLTDSLFTVINLPS